MAHRTEQLGGGGDGRRAVRLRVPTTTIHILDRSPRRLRRRRVGIRIDAGSGVGVLVETVVDRAGDGEHVESIVVRPDGESSTGGIEVEAPALGTERGDRLRAVLRV